MTTKKVNPDEECELYASPGRTKRHEVQVRKLRCASQA